jgi:hypothetical protein
MTPLLIKLNRLHDHTLSTSIAAFLAAAALVSVVKPVSHMKVQIQLLKITCNNEV